MIVTTTTNARASWAEKITATYKAGVMGLLQIGVQLAAAKKALSPQDYAAMIATDLPFGDRAAQMYVAIGASEKLAKHVSLLPPAMSTLYQLHRLPEKEFERAVKKGLINPEMERRDVAALHEAIQEKVTPTRPSTGAHAPVAEATPTRASTEPAQSVPIAAPAEARNSAPSSLFHELSAYVTTLAAFIRRADVREVAHGALHAGADGIKNDLGAVRTWLADLDEALRGETIDRAAE